jgi:hypothetical protein
MSEDKMTGLLGESAFSFVGTVEHVNAATMEEVPIDEHTAVVHVDQVLHAPDAFAQLAGTSVTLQLAPGSDAVEPDSRWAFFANGVAFGASLVLAEVGRAPVDQVEAGLAQAGGPAAGNPLADLQAQIDSARVREHAASADAVILGRVIALERVLGSPIYEHDPDWWCATLHAVHVERGDVPDDPDDKVKVLYANSLDVVWRDAPKPKAAQNGLWLLHATDGDLRELAPFQILHSEDFQPVQELESLRENGG